MNLDPDNLRLVQANQVALDVLADLFESLAAGPDASFFRPHPLTSQAAARIAAYDGHDFYGVATSAEILVGYGILRGWDEGYEVPSLGLAVTPVARRTGVAEWLLSALHDEARRRGATAVRLTVDVANLAAQRLYAKAGYRLVPYGAGRLVGMLSLVGAE